MLDQGQRTVELIDRGDSEGGGAGSGPDERVLAVEIKGHGFSPYGEAHPATDKLFPSPAVESVVPEAGNDPVIGDEPRPRLGPLSCGDLDGCCRDVCGEVQRGLGPDPLAFVENDPYTERP
jgi:hypothetical protein